MSNLPKIGDTIKTGTLEEIKAIEGVTVRDDGGVWCNGDGIIYGTELRFLNSTHILKHAYDCDCDYIFLDIGKGECISYPKWAYEAFLPKPTKQPKKSPLETERDQLEARLALVKEGVTLESEIKTDASDLKAKRARLAEIKKNGGIK